jgi:hypothetical protein
LQQQVCTLRRSLHLLLFDEPLADDLINRRFDKRGTDRFALPVAFSEVRNIEARTPSISSMPP